MATDQQVALTRSNRMPAQSSHISKAARQVVPAFLQKLYECVAPRVNHQMQLMSFSTINLLEW